MELEQALAQPDVYNDQDQYRKLTKAHADLRDVVELFRRHRSLTQELEENKQLLHDSDPDIKAMAQEEIAAAEAELPELEHKIKVLLLPKDPLDEKNTILEIRAGTGGEEAALFAADLFRMYTRYADDQGLEGGDHERIPFRQRRRTRKSSASSPVTACTATSSSRPVPTACSACPPPRPRAASTPPPPPWP